MINVQVNNFGAANPAMGGFAGGFALGGGFSTFTPASSGFGNGPFNPASLGFGGGLMSGCGCGGASPLGAGYPAGGIGGGDMMSSMMMLSNMMMMMMANMMANLVAGQMPMSGGPGQFGGPMAGGGMGGGSPLNGFLGGPGKGKKKRKPGKGKGKGKGKGANGVGNAGATQMDANGKVGDVNVEKLIRAIPEGYRTHARKHWPAIVAEAQKQGIKDKGALAYILATTVHESGAGKYMEEIASGSAYEGRSDLGNNRPGDGVRFKGRGYVQITGRNNYTNWGKKLGINLVGNPELAERPEIAAKILVGGMKSGSFTGRGLDRYFAGSKNDFVGARAIVNGSDKAGTFAATAQAILRAMG